jgi:hypothetical protein
LPSTSTVWPGLSSWPANSEPIITIVAPKRMLLAMSPLWRMPPSAMIGLVATRAHHFSADSCQPPVPKPVFSA